MWSCDLVYSLFSSYFILNCIAGDTPLINICHEESVNIINKKLLKFHRPWFCMATSDATSSDRDIMVLKSLLCNHLVPHRQPARTNWFVEKHIIITCHQRAEFLRSLLHNYHLLPANQNQLICALTAALWFQKPVTWSFQRKPGHLTICNSRKNESESWIMDHYWSAIADELFDPCTIMQGIDNSS